MKGKKTFTEAFTKKSLRKIFKLKNVIFLKTLEINGSIK